MSRSLTALAVALVLGIAACGSEGNGFTEPEQPSPVPLPPTDVSVSTSDNSARISWTPGVHAVEQGAELRSATLGRRIHLPETISTSATFDSLPRDRYTAVVYAYNFPYEWGVNPRVVASDPIQFTVEGVAFGDALLTSASLDIGPDRSATLLLTNLTETKLRMISLRSRAPYNTLYLGEDRSRYCPAMGPKLNPATVFSFAPDSAQAVEVEFNLSAPSAQDCPGGFYETQITASVNGIVIAEAIIHHEWWED